ncbi:MAG: hypothetical protein AVDCRST_MAG88-819, partial [uncultured Thermomicrobiales bacterium]
SSGRTRRARATSSSSCSASGEDVPRLR